MIRTFWLAAAGAGLLAAESDVRAFFSTYCTSCHGAQAQMAQRRFDRIALPARDSDTLSLLQDAADRLTLGTMPPAAARQPSADEKRAVLDALRKAIGEGRAKSTSTGAQTVLRRLNRREYLNTVGDLLGINMLMFDPTSGFPRDQQVGHMDNIGDALVTSGYLLEQYLDAADQAVEKAFRADLPAPRTWTFRGPFRQQPEIDYAQSEVFQQRYLTLYSVQKTVNEEGAYAPLYAFAQGVPADGHYEIEVQAEAVNRKNPYDPKLFHMDPDAPFRLGIVAGDAKVGALHHAQPIEPKLAEEVALADSGPEWHKFRVWLDAGYTPRFTFPNGMNDSRRAFTVILSRYRNLLPEDQRNFAPGIRPARPLVLRHGFMPQVRIHEVRITGPLAEAGPRASQRLLFGDRPFDVSRTREVIARFASRAYRRPARTDEVDRLVALAERRRGEGKSPVAALKDALKAVLCSPAFLYLSETNVGRTLPAHALASRLSYFLWSAMPDEELRSAADSGSLLKPEVLRAQFRRMLASPRSSAFVDGFLDSWLNLRSLGDMPPDRDAFGRYYSQDLESAMRTETRMFTRHLLDGNEPVSRFLDAPYTFVNKPLAEHYGIKGLASIDGHRFRKVALADPNRGGLLGQASVLTVSANGVETSPVTRGVWMLENIFGTPPSPPPDNVPAIDPDVRGAKSIREILTKHRESPACMACHRTIDPPGFALENFNPVGGWRAEYPNGASIDASGELAGGRKFTGVAELRKLLVERKSEFARVVAERLLMYGCGRRMEAADRAAIGRMMAEWSSRGEGFRDLVETVVLSEAFRAK